MEPKTTGKRMVSKAEYTANIRKKPLSLLVCIGILAIGLMLCALVITQAILVNSFQVMLLILAAGAPSSVLFLWLGFKCIQKIAPIDVGVPLTRASAADLPAPASLVRASSEPMQGQQTVLLRAAVAEQDKREEQLLRAVEGQA